MMKPIYALIAVGLILLAVLQNFLWLAGLFALGFTFFFGAAFLFPVALLIDSYFNAFSMVPVFSLLTILWYVVSELIRMKMRIMN